MKSVVFLVINSLYGGGAEHVASRLSQEWVKHYDLKVISLQPLSDSDYNFSGEKISLSSLVRRKLWLSRIREYSRLLDKLADDYKPFTIVSFLQNSNLAVSMMHYKCIKIVSVRNYLPRLHKGIKRYFWRFLIWRYYGRVQYVVSVSELINVSMYTTYGVDKNKCRCIYNPYDIENIIALSQMALDKKATDFYSKHSVLSNMGNLSTAKGQFHLIRILNELKKEIPTVGLVILGKDKGLLDKLQGLVKAYGLTDSVLFAGHHDNPYKYISKSKCFVFPSLWEGFPNALVEAMLCKVPVVSSDCKSGPREILEPSSDVSYGVLLEDDTVSWLNADVPLTITEKKYVQKIKEILRDNAYQSELSLKAFERATDFSMEKIVADWYKLIDSYNCISKQ